MRCRWVYTFIYVKEGASGRRGYFDSPSISYFQIDILSIWWLFLVGLKSRFKLFHCPSYFHYAWYGAAKKFYEHFAIIDILREDEPLPRRVIGQRRSFPFTGALMWGCGASSLYFSNDAFRLIEYFGPAAIYISARMMAPWLSMSAMRWALSTAGRLRSVWLHTVEARPLGLARSLYYFDADVSHRGAQRIGASD